VTHKTNSSGSTKLATITVRAMTRPPSQFTSLDHLVGPGEHRWRDFKAERLRGLEIDYQFVLGRRLHRQVGGLLALDVLAVTIMLIATALWL
jgi:hypothetical protein